MGQRGHENDPSEVRSNISRERKVKSCGRGRGAAVPVRFLIGRRAKRQGSGNAARPFRGGRRYLSGGGWPFGGVALQILSNFEQVVAS